MFKGLTIAATAVAMAGAALVPTAAEARHWHGGHHGYSNGYYGGGGYHGRSGYYGRGDYYRGGYGYRGGRRYYGRCDRGTGGTIIGAIAGGLLGNEIAGRGDRTTGAIVGAGAGALIGRSIDRNC